MQINQSECLSIENRLFLKVSQLLLSLIEAPSCVLKFALGELVSGASYLVCSGWGTYPGACFGSVFQEQASSCVLVGVFTREGVSGVCFRSKLPRVYRPQGNRKKKTTTTTTTTTQQQKQIGQNN